MGKKDGIAGIVFFVFFIILSIIIASELGTNAELDLEIAIVILVELFLFCSTAFLIPGIVCLLGKHFGAKVWYYALIPVTLLGIVIYTMVVAILAPTSFMITFLEFLGLGIGAAVVLAIVILCMSYEKYS